MPKRRATGAQRPYAYWKRWTDRDGVEHKVQRWRVRLDIGTDENGNRVRKTFTGRTSAECQRKLREARKQFAEKGAVALAGRKPTLGEYASMFLDDARHHLSPRSLTSYRSDIARLSDWTPIRIDRFTASMVQGIVNALSDRGLSAATRRHVVAVLRQVFDMAVRDGVIAANPASSIRTGRVGTSGRKAFSIPEIRAVLETASNIPVEEGAVWWWRFFTGMRQAEILGALREDLHLEGPFPRYVVNWSLTEVRRRHGCGRTKDGWSCGLSRAADCPRAEWIIPDDLEMRHLHGRFWLKRPKSGRPRTVPLSPELAEVMRRYLVVTEGRPSPYGLLFPDVDGSVMDPVKDRERFRMLLERAGLDPDSHTGHETRYSAVTLMRRAGVDRKARLEIIGHTADDVDDIYMTVDDATAAEAVGAIGSQLGVAGLLER